MTLPRPRTLLLTALAVLLVILGLLWWTSRNQVAWSVELDDADAVVDADAGRVLVETFDEALVVLDREDGSEVATVRLPPGASLDQSALLPDGGLVAAWSGDSGTHQVAQYDARGRERWLREDVERILGLGADGEVVAVRTSGRDGITIGVGADGEEVWRAAGPGTATGPRSSGRELAEANVSVVTAGADGEFAVVDLDDGQTLGPLAAGSAPPSYLAYWHDRVLMTREGDTVLYSVGGETTALVGGEDVVGGILSEAAAGAIAVATRDGWWAIDAEAGTAEPFDDDFTDYDSVYDSRLVPVPSGDDVRVFDVATGSEAFSISPGHEALTAQSGPDSVLVIEAPGWFDRLRHLSYDDDAGRLHVVTEDGDEHGSWVTTNAEVIDMWVADEHEAVVVTKDPDGEEPHRVVLLGR